MSKVYLDTGDLILSGKILGMPAAPSAEYRTLTCPGYLPRGTEFYIMDPVPTVIDDNMKPLNPFRGVNSRRLLETLAMYELRPDARILPFHVPKKDVLLTDNSFLRTLYFGFGDAEKDFAFFMIAQKGTENKGTEVKPEWREILPEIDASNQSFCKDAVPRWTLWHSRGGRNALWDVWVVPVGYFAVAKTADGMFYNQTIRGGETSPKRYASDLFEENISRMRNLYTEVCLEEELAYQDAARTQFVQQLDKAERVAQLQQVCAELNERMDVVRQNEMFSDYARFVVDGCKIKLASSQPLWFYPSGAEQYVHNIEVELRNYEQFQPEFESLRERIEKVGGTLMTAASSYSATARFPREMSNSTDSKVYEKRSFPFALIGVTQLTEWLKEVEDRINGVSHPSGT